MDRKRAEELAFLAFEAFVAEEKFVNKFSKSEFVGEISKGEAVFGGASTKEIQEFAEFVWDSAQPERVPAEK